MNLHGYICLTLGKAISDHPTHAKRTILWLSNTLLFALLHGKRWAYLRRKTLLSTNMTGSILL